MRKTGTWGGLGLVFAALATAAVGCGEEAMPTTASAARDSGSMTTAAPATAPPGQAAANEGVPARAATAGRKIVYNAYVDLVTEDLNALTTSLNALIVARGAYVADSDRTGSAGSSRRGSWKVRVPADGYDPFVKGVVALGELVSIRADSQDVSEEYFDTEARQTAKQVEEARLLKHLTDSTGKLDDILAVERELSRVRTEIERMQGRLRVLADLTSLATVSITVSEIKGYVPPQAPTLATRIGRTFEASVGSLRHFGEEVLIGLVALVPWLPLIALGLAVVVWAARRSWALTRPLLTPVGPHAAGPPPGSRG